MKNEVFHIIHTHGYLDSKGNEILEKAYRLWKAQWKAVYRSQKSDHEPQAEDFLRYDIVTCLQEGSHIMGMSAHTFYDLQRLSSRETEFLQMFGRSFVKKLRSRSISHVSSYESLLVHPNYRGRDERGSIGTVLILLGNMLLTTTHADALVATARKDVGVSGLAQRCGYDVIQANKMCRGFRCDLIAQFNGNFMPSQSLLSLRVKKLWARRVEHIGIPFVDTKISIQRKVA